MHKKSGGFTASAFSSYSDRVDRPAFARFEIEKMLEERVNLKIWVKVKKDWRDSDTLMKNFGYNKKEI